MSSKAERKEAVRNETEKRNQSASNTPWFTWREVPMILLFLPFGLLLGFHVAFFAMFIRWTTRLPYWIAFVMLYGLLICPLWLYSNGNVVVLSIGSIVVLLGSLLPRAFDDQDGILNGGNLEHSAPAHILLILLYLLIPAVNAAIEAHHRLQERQNNGMHAEPPNARFDDGEITPAAR